MEVDWAILGASSQVRSSANSKIRFVEPELLERKKQKANKSDTGGMERYASWFPFQYKEFKINVDQCFLALDHYNCCQMEETQSNSCMLFFAASANRPCLCICV